MSLQLDDGADLAPTGIEGGAVGVSGEVGLRQCLDALERHLGVPAGALEIVRECPDCGPGDHGAPRLRGTATALGSTPLPSISVSRTKGPAAVTVLAWCDPAWRIGVDVEDLSVPATRHAFTPGPDGTAEIDVVAFSPDERAGFARLSGEAAARARAALWCSKEALVKARGTGFTGDPADVGPCAGEFTAVLGPAVVGDSASVSRMPDVPTSEVPASGVAVRPALPDGVVLALAWGSRPGGPAQRHRRRDRDTRR